MTIYHSFKRKIDDHWENITMPKTELSTAIQHESVYVILLVVLFSAFACSQNTNHQIKIMGQHRGLKWEEECLQQKPEWYGTDEAQRIADNMLYYQNEDGGWPKNLNMTAPLAKGKKILREDPDLSMSTIDNSATYTQMRFLDRVYLKTKKQVYADAFVKGFDYLIRAQYENGGWPQFYPLRKGYYTHITFNDDAMVGVLFLLKDITKQPELYPFINAAQREKANLAIEKGIKCILKCQVKVDGKLTAWCAQHDEKTFAPAKARSYELPSLSGKESVGIVEFLMSLEKPDSSIIQSVQSAVKWFDRVRIKGLMKKWVSDSSVEGGYNKITYKDPGAPPIWARFYEIGTNQYFFCNRDGSKHYDLSELTAERRNDYGWLGYWPEELLTKFYPEWQKKWAPDNNVLQ